MANLVTVRADKLDKLKGRFTKAQQAVAAAVEEALDEYGETYVGELQKHLPVRTGKLKGSAKYIVKGRGTKDMQLEVRLGESGQPKQLPVWLNFGTGIYGPRRSPIRPRKAKRLRFVAKSGKTVFAKQVRGVKPMRFLDKTDSATQSARRRLVARVGKLAITRLLDSRE